MVANHLWAVMLALAVVLPVARGIWLELPGKEVKCLSEELQNKVVVFGEYYAFYGEHDDINSTSSPSISVKVTSPHGNELHHNEKVPYGKFAFTTTESGSYHACFWVDGEQTGRNITVGLDWKNGIATKDWDSIAKKEKIEGLDLELKKLEVAVEYIHDKMIHMMSREMAMKVVNDATNARVAKYSVLSLGLCVVVSILQLLYLRRYFRKKKLI
ncbi:hypothetical protein CASFOL_012580 [Castilleja foliolosa]|uniref:GOLD domain-containing protein n=1 Tax=Castilleja foliolosa TaxID=1961234 RepID=A0ABD3DHI8_9LAMI